LALPDVDSDLTGPHHQLGPNYSACVPYVPNFEPDSWDINEQTAYEKDDEPFPDEEFERCEDGDESDHYQAIFFSTSRERAGSVPLASALDHELQSAIPASGCGRSHL